VKSENVVEESLRPGVDRKSVYDAAVTRLSVSEKTMIPP